MMHPAYIISSAAISAQHSYDGDMFALPLTGATESMLKITDPDYTQYIPPVPIRRMSRMLKVGITAGMRCLELAGVKTPGAIITGTARGSVNDMEFFLNDMLRLNEEALNPTGFIQSTYNAVNGWLAVMSKCTGYNQAYVNRGFSFELALIDAMLFFAEAAGPATVLAGAFDEITAEYVKIRSKISFYKQPQPYSLDLLKHYDTPGSIGGEGASFFMLTNDKAGTACGIYAVKMLPQPGTDELLTAADDMLKEHGLTKDNIDVLLSGMNGDSRNAIFTMALTEAFPENTTVATYKQLCGEYDTASGFGLWLAHYIFRHGNVPAQITYKQGNGAAIKNMLLYNVNILNQVTLMLVRGGIQ